MDELTRTKLEAAAFRGLVAHLRQRTDVQNIDIMNLAGFCRNCLSKWYLAAADEQGVALTREQALEAIYGMPYPEWKARYQREASKEQLEMFEQTRPLAGQTILCCLHLEAKTGYLLQTLQTAGARVVACASNPLSTQDDVVAALVESGIIVFAIHGESAAQYHDFLQKGLDCLPDAIIDDGADLVSMLHKDRRDQAASIIGGCEETTTGIVRPSHVPPAT